MVISLVYGEPLPEFPYLHTVEPVPFLEDLLAFFAILRLPGRWAIRRFDVPGLLGTILRDARKYFLVIFTAHFVLAMTLLFARVSSTTYSANHDDTKRFI